MSQSSTRGFTGKVYDPVFLCMIGAVALAVATSIGLRVMVAGAGPSAARAADAPPSIQDTDPYLPSNHGATTTRPSPR